jgi:hypothetical protein
MFFASAIRPRFLVSAFLSAFVLHGYGQAIPPATAIPIVFTRSLAAGPSRPGDPVSAKTIQAVTLPNGTLLPAGAQVLGHVVASTPFVFDATPYAAQKSSLLSIHFDSIAETGAPIPVALSVRAIAGPVASRQAETPRFADEKDWSGALLLIGGETTAPLEKTILSSDGNVVGYNRKQGAFARLLPAASVNPDADVQCGATDPEQSIGIFSADACGAYGLNSVSLIASGSRGDGTFVLESHQRSVKLYAGSTALLQVVAR